MTNLNRKHLKQDNCEKDNCEKGTSGNDILNVKQDKSEKGQFRTENMKGTI